MPKGFAPPRVAPGKRAAGGRPSDYSPAVAAAICNAIAEGKSLREICGRNNIPGKSTILRWLSTEERKEFRDQYARAREAQADTLAEDILAIADDVDADSASAVNKARLRVDARKWLAGKLAPKKYGDKIELSGDPERPASVNVGVLTVMPDRSEFEKIRARALSKK